MLLLLQGFFMFLQVTGGGSFPKTLTPEEEKHYLQLFEHGSEEERKAAKAELISRNLRLVAHIVKKYNSKDVDDLISIGTIGLIKGISTFNSERGTKLATYASRCVENEILMHMRSQKKINKEVFMNDPIGVDKEGNQVTMEDKLKDEGYSIDEAVSLKLDIRQLYRKMKTALTDREKLILDLRYGLCTGEEITQRETAGRLKISRSYVSRIEKRALNKLYHEMNS